MQEQQGYGAYTGNQNNQSYQSYYDGPQQAQVTPTPSQNDMYDDAFIDSLSLRLSQRMAQGPQGKLHFPSGSGSKATAGQKLALAIVSIVMLVPLSGIMVGLVAASHFWWVGLAGLGIICLTLFLINAVFDEKA